ncbi:hypothetical protein GCM10020221_14950 [Streptomyces thioluteus]|uniref:Uncharacterized protein n=1 Tax=Streptomyces thioluteus TaxID=66431 RepID=A0ABN3WMH5_STRTU
MGDDNVSMYKDRQGTSISVERWGQLWEDKGYRVVAETRDGDLIIRTVWEGVAGSPVGVMYASGVSHDGGKTFRTRAQWAQTEPEAEQQHSEVLAQLSQLTGD